MEFVNLSNKAFDTANIMITSNGNINSKSGKPMCGTWFSRAIKDERFYEVCEWHDYIEYNMLNPKTVQDLYLTNNKTTFVTTLTLKPTTKNLAVSQIEECFNKKMNTQEIINHLQLKNVTELLLTISSKKDYEIICNNYPNWDDMPRVENSEVWQYISSNFVGCNFDKNLFKELDRAENNLVYILDIPSFVAFSAKGFDFASQEKQLRFRALEKKHEQEFCF